MSDDLDHRVGQLEVGQAETKQRLGHIETTVEKTSRGMDQLLERDARRPEPASIRTVFFTVVSCLAGCGVIAGFVWWVVAASPAVTSLTERLTELDHPRVGRVPTLERKVDVLGGWKPRVFVNSRISD